MRTVLADSESAAGHQQSAAIPIVFLVPQLTVGGTENQLSELVVRLNRELFRPAVWCPGPWGPVGDRMMEANIPVCRIRLSSRRPISFARSVRWLRKMQPQIFHSFSYGEDAHDVLAARLAGIPIFLTSRRNIRHWNPDGRVRWRERLRNRWTNLVLANSNAAALAAAEMEGLPPDRIRVIYNGVTSSLDGNGFALRQGLGVKKDCLLVGNVANLKHVKGQDVLLRAFRRVVDHVPNAFLAICGAGESREILEQLCHRLGLAARVFFLGLRLDVKQVYRSLDLYVHSSRAEGFPNSVLEAMAYRLPVVATSAGGTAEALSDGAGWLVPSENPELLGNAMIRMLQDEPLRRRIALEGQRRAVRHFTFSRMVAEHEQLYFDLLRGIQNERSADWPENAR
jgi:glycosyltransferase involved in cell wall biosynthesis